MESESNQVDVVEKENVHHYHVAEEQSLSDGVIRAVAAILEREPIPADKPGAGGQKALEPLCDVIDPDALDTLFQTGKVTRQVEFMYGGCAVTVKGTGEVTVTKSHPRGSVSDSAVKHIGTQHPGRCMDNDTTDLILNLYSEEEISEYAARVLLDDETIDR